MRRGWVYLAIVLAAGALGGLWFALTEEVDPAATEPAAYDLFLLIAVVLAAAGAAASCGLYELVHRLRGRRRRAA